jgi:transcription antitermination factor NusG
MAKEIFKMNGSQQWYAVYTRPRWEKKVAEVLTQKNIENYCPLNKVRKQWADRKKIVFEPLFKSYVFVKICEMQHLQLKQTTGIINLIYWLGKPAVIREAEIDLIKRFLQDHSNVKLEKVRLNVNDRVRVISGPLMEQEGQVVAVHNKTVKISLPSLGFVMAAEVQTANVEVIRSEIASQKIGYSYAAS